MNWAPPTMRAGQREREQRPRAAVDHAPIRSTTLPIAVAAGKATQRSGVVAHCETCADERIDLAALEEVAESRAKLLVVQLAVRARQTSRRRRRPPGNL